MKYVMRDGNLIEKHLADPLTCKEDAIHVISDTMDLTRHMADGRHYDSKSVFRKVTRAHNCIEYGNENATILKPRKNIELDRQQRRNDIRRAFAQWRDSGSAR
jgi:hypothetical protein